MAPLNFPQLDQQFSSPALYGGAADLYHFFEGSNDPRAQSIIVFRQVCQGLQRKGLYNLAFVIQIAKKNLNDSFTLLAGQ